MPTLPFTTRSIFTSALLLSCGTLLGHAMTLQDPAGQEKPGEPVEMHAAMMLFAGSYTTKTTFQAAPEAEVIVTEGTAEMVASLGGRFLVEENNGTFMGEPFEGINIWGYNAGSEEFEACWMWTNSTGILSMRGKPNMESGVTDWTASYRDGTGAEQEMHVTTTVPAPETMIVHMFAPIADTEQEHAMMIIEYHKK